MNWEAHSKTLTFSGFALVIDYLDFHRPRRTLSYWMPVLGPKRYVLGCFFDLGQWRPYRVE